MKLSNGEGTVRGLLMIALAACQFQSVSFANEVIDAVRAGDQNRLQQVLKGESDVNQDQGDGTTALAWAVYNNDEKAVAALIRAGADVNIANEYGVSPLHLACSNQNTGIADRLIKAGADVNQAKWTGETPLMTCAGTGAVDALRLLLARGADPNAREKTHDQTALMWAAAEKHPDAVRELLKHGANVEARSRLVQMPAPFVIKVPSSFGQNFPKPVRFRESSGNFTPLLFAARSGDLETVRLLIEAGADINETTEEEGSALVVASAAGYEEIAKYLLAQGADPNIADGWGATAMHYAVHEGLLIINGYTHTRTDYLGWERHNMPGLLSALISRGGNVEARLTNSFSYLDNPFLRGIEDPPQIDGTGATPLLLAAASGDIECMRILVEEGKANIRARTDSGATLFMLAAGAGSEVDVRDEEQAIAAAKYAMELGDTDVNVRLTNDDAVNGPGKGKIDGRATLHFAASLGWEKMVRFLAEQGADMNPEDRYGQTPLMIAMGDPESRYYRNIPIGRYDDRYRRPPNSGYRHVVDALLEVGAKPFTGRYIDKGSVN